MKNISTDFIYIFSLEIKKKHWKYFVEVEDR